MRYNAYDLRIESELTLPELVADPREGAVDVRIRLGQVDLAAVPDEFREGPLLWVSPDCLWLHVPDIAKFCITRGCEIVIEPARGADEDSIRVFLLGSAFGALLMQRKYLVLHGNAIRIGDQCMVCVGQSGAGKSTLAAGFMQRGYTILADDVVPVTAEGDAIPGFPRIKLWQDMATKLRIDTRALRQIRPGIKKYNLPIPGDAAVRRLPVRWVYVLCGKRFYDGVALEPLRGMNRFTSLRHHTYRRGYLEGLGLKRSHLQMCGNLAGRIHLSRVRVPHENFALDELMDALLDDMTANP